MTLPIDKSFWETKHDSNDIWWISGTRFKIMLEQHNLSPDDFKNKKILEIGVGTGSMSEVLPNYSSEIYCCDISQTALDNVKQYATQTFLTEKLKDIPPVDLAFSHLVFQHCTDKEILRIINEVNLTDNGVFSFEFVSLVDNVIIDKVQNFIDNKTHFFRSLEDLKSLLKDSNKEIVKVEVPVFHQKWQFESNFVKVKNK
jgi:predicted TPR repeat methyltransferase